MTETNRVDAREQMEWWEKEKKNKRPPVHPAVEAFALPKVDIIASLIGLNENTSVLDVGCGNGFFTHYFAQKTPHVVGMDLSQYMLGMNSHDKLVRGRAEELPFDDKSFDLVFCSNLLHHVENPVDVVKEMVRVSKRFVSLSEPNARNPFMYLFSYMKKEERGALKFTPDYLESVAHNAGLREIHLSEHGSVVPNKTPGWTIPLFKPFNTKIDRGFYTLFVGDRMDGIDY